MPRKKDTELEEPAIWVPDPRQPPEPAPVSPPEPTLAAIDLASREPSHEFERAFAKAQAAFGPIKRSKEVEVTSRRTGARYKFKYAPLDEVLAAVLPALNAHGFTLTQRIVKTDMFQVATRLMHPSGELKNLMPIWFQDNSPSSQDFAGATSYARRYGITLLLCLASEDDDDGNLAEGNTVHAISEGSGKKGKGKPAAPATAQERANGDIPQLSREVRIPDDPEELERCEGQIVDTVSDMIEAAHEGRSVGIRQIWDEISSNEYVAHSVWERLKEAPDAFATIKAVLKPATQGPRSHVR